MTITLAQARTRVRFLIDDADANPLVSDAEIDVALATALEEVWQRVVGSGASCFTISADITSSQAGVVDMTALKPLRIVNVVYATGTIQLQVQPSRTSDYIQKVSGAQPLRIWYVPRATFPALSSDPFVWSTAAISSATLDQLLCVIAAADVWVKTGEPPLASLEQRKAELVKAVEQQVSIPDVTVAPLRVTRKFPTNRYAGFQWARVGHDTLQLVYA